MCGLADVLLFGGARENYAIENAVHRMCDRMQARDSDAVGYWSDSDLGLTLGYHRLSILDLEARANQPLASDDGCYVIVFNGEICNFHELHRSLDRDDEVCRTQSDTEVLLKLYAREGETMLSRLRGMFAFAIWNRQTRSVFLGCNPYGIKPLYLARSKEGWLLGSEIRVVTEQSCRQASPISTMVQGSAGPPPGCGARQGEAIHEASRSGLCAPLSSRL